jgi:hypothetical protein
MCSVQSRTCSAGRACACASRCERRRREGHQRPRHPPRHTHMVQSPTFSNRPERTPNMFSSPPPSSFPIDIDIVFHLLFSHCISFSRLVQQPGWRSDGPMPVDACVFGEYGSGLEERCSKGEGVLIWATATFSGPLAASGDVMIAVGSRVAPV